MKANCFLLLATAAAVTAAPACPFAGLKKRQPEDDQQKRQSPILDEINEGNCGPIPCTTFNAQDQFIDVRPGTTHEYRAPRSSDKRGPCPGLNAAANHGYISRNGITTLLQATTGLYELYGIGEEFAAALIALAIGISGDPIALTWSIGGPYPGTPLLSDPSGISFTHNTYEGDGSPTRPDAYMNGGDPNPLDLWRFNSLYSKANDQGEFTPTILRRHNKEMDMYGKQNNAYFFHGPLAGLVPVVAHQFIPNFFSNHSADNPNGYLSKEILKSFFSVSGPENAHIWNPGQERIPLNWYRRPLSNPYDSRAVALDATILATIYPEILAIGGNTGSPNTFTGVDPENVTGGLYNAQTLFEGNNFACYALQFYQTTILSRLNIVEQLLLALTQPLQSVLATWECPQLTSQEFDQTEYEQFPGYNSRSPQ